MIINHTYRFIYLKTKKTAGTSIEIALSQYCGPQDIVTRLGARDEPKRTALGYQGPTNYLIPREQWTRADRRHHLRCTLHRWQRTMLGREINLRKEVSYYNHMTALELRGRLPADTWNDYFKFSTERNPWDRAISAYHWENRGRRRLPAFGRFLKEMHRDRKISNFETYAIDGKIAVDKVLLYENLSAELEALVTRLGLPGPLELPNAKRQYRKDRRPYQEVYSPWERDFIAQVCAREIKEFGYRFE
jgi:hypothetical protein